jgi:hypothetical protein
VNGDTYTGELKDGKFHGRGVYTTSTYTFEGMWKKSSIEGPGSFKFSNGSIEKGTYRKGKRFGAGEDQYINGESYVGEFFNEMKYG